jgi:hypothetical protein
MKNLKREKRNENQELQNKATDRYFIAIAIEINRSILVVKI